MSARRLDTGGLIDRDQARSFRFDGAPFTGFAGDTLASALLAQGVQVVGRSFKYHRPRGLWGAWFDDPNAIFDVSLGPDALPNCPATTTALVDGMDAKAVNAWPSARHDIKGGLDLFHRWLGAGFYYKMFMWPDWHLFEPAIRKMAGLGALEPSAIAGHVSDQRDARCDTLVVGGGAAGLIAARAAAEAGQEVVLIDDHPEAGGGVYRRGQTIDGLAPADWVATQVQALRKAGARILTGTTAYGAYDHGLVALVEDRGFAKAPRLWRMRAGRTVLATGATDRPLTFANNDLPGIMSVEAGCEYLARYGVLVGARIVLASTNSFGNQAHQMLSAAGAQVQCIDPADAALRANGRGRVRSLTQGNSRYKADVVLASAGWTPLLHLWRHAGGKLEWCDTRAAFLPGAAPATMQAIGAANGTYDFDAAMREAAAIGAGQPHPRTATHYTNTPHWPKPGQPGRHWIDSQNDVTLKDIETAARENFVSVEHLKRYTTLGMGSDQGKTSNMAGLAAMATLQGKSIPEVGTTTFRPPFVPVPFELYHGAHRGQGFHGPKRLALEPQHRRAGAALGEYGGWLRPGWYGPTPDAIPDEALLARQNLALFDASPLGKIEVMGPDAETFVNFIYYNTIKTLKPGALRYGLMLTEQGIVYDDGVIARIDQNRFVISCSSSHVDGVTAMLDSWRQDGNDPDRIFVHDTTQNWATLTLTGPRARDALRRLDLDVDLSAKALPHMRFCETGWQGHALRIARVSFTGDLSFEMSISASAAPLLWDATLAATKAEGGGLIGVEALSILRAEKGFLIIGKDTDGQTMPHDLGFTAPRLRKTSAFVGDRSLHSKTANDPNRRQWVGLTVAPGQPALPTGAHIVTPGATPRSIGIVTSSYDSPVLGHPIALALLERGLERLGETVRIWHMGATSTAQIAPICALDPEGERLNAQ